MACALLYIVTVQLEYSRFRKAELRVGLGLLGVLCEAHPQLHYLCELTLTLSNIIHIVSPCVRGADQRSHTHFKEAVC